MFGRLTPVRRLHSACTSSVWSKSRSYHAPVSNPDYLVIDEESGRKIPYQRVKPVPGNITRPGLIFIHGFQSNMDGAKAHLFDQNARKEGVGYVRFDLEGARSPGSELKNLKFKYYVDDCLAVIDKLSTGPQVIIGSSLGGWLAILTALQRPERVRGLVLVSTSVNFLRYYFNSFYSACPEDARKLVDTGGTYTVQTKYGPISMNKAFVESSYPFELNLDEPIKIKCPVRIIHGMKDDAADYKNSIALLDAIKSKDVDIFLRKHGLHQFSEPADLKLIWRTVYNTFLT